MVSLIREVVSAGAIVSFMAMVMVWADILGRTG